MRRQLLKNRWNRGAAVLIAIFVFFLAALSGTIVLIMASSNAGRYTHEKEDQQAYLAVASAYKLILDEIGSVRVHFDGTADDVPQNETQVSEPKFYKAGTAEGVNQELTDLKLFFSDSQFKTQLKQNLPYGTISGGTAEGSSEVTPIPGYKPISFTLSVADDEKNAVYVELDMSQKTQLVFRFWYKENGRQNYQMSVYITLDTGAQWETDGEEGEGEGEGVKKTDYHIDLTWDTEKADFIFESEFSNQKSETEEGATV